MVKLKTVSKKHLRERNQKAYHENTKAALSLQRWYRGYVARREVNRVKRAVTQLQAGTRGRLARKMLNHEKGQAEKIQRLFRGHQARKKVTQHIEDQTSNLAATMVQARMRAMINRRRLRQTIKSGVKLQAAWRGYYVRRRFREEYDRKAQIIIQSRMFESKKVQWYLERERQVMRSKIAVFREWAHSAGKRRAIARQRDTAALTIQRCFRGYLAKQKRGMLRDERQRGKELTKFVELLRSHMSMVIFEEKERHSLAFPVKGGAKAKKTPALPAIKSAAGRRSPPGRENVGHGGGAAGRGGRQAAGYDSGERGYSGYEEPAGWHDGRRPRSQLDERPSSSSSRRGGARSGERSEHGERGRRRAGAGGGGGHVAGGGGRGGRNGRGGSGRSGPSGGGRPQRGDSEYGAEAYEARGAAPRAAPPMRKAEIEDAMALADLLNLRGDDYDGGGGGGDPPRRQRGAAKPRRAKPSSRSHGVY
jgi:hypothetical protein